MINQAADLQDAQDLTWTARALRKKVTLPEMVIRI